MAFLQTALNCASFGLRVFPVIHPGIDMEPKGKRPAIRGWPTRATADRRQLEKWAAKWPDHNCGVCTTDFVALDIDGPEGVESLHRLEAKHGQLPVTMKTISSGPNRFHLVFRMPPGLQVASSNDRSRVLGLGIDIKGRRSYVMAPGSLHKSGALYTSVNGPDMIADAPAWLLCLVTTCPTEPRDHAEPPSCPSLATEDARTAPELAGAKAEREKNSPGTVGTKSDAYALDSLLQEVIERFPASLESRHFPMLKFVGSLVGGKGLDDETIIEVGTRWLRHFEGQYGLTFERALAELHKCLEFTRNNEKFSPFKRGIEGVELSLRERFVIECVAETRDEELFLEVVLREWRLDWERYVITARRPSNVGDACEESLWSGKVPLSLTNQQLLTGFRVLSQGKGDLRKVLRLRDKFFTLNPAPYGDGQVSRGSKARQVELFIRTQAGTRGKPSLYAPSPCLLELLNGRNPFRVKNLARLASLDRNQYHRTQHWKRFRTTVLKRDDRRCRCCGRRTGLRVVWTWQGWQPQGAEAGFADDYVTVCSGCHMIAAAIRADEPIIIAGNEVKQIDPQRLAGIVRVFKLVGDKHGGESRAVGRGDSHVGVANRPAGGEPVADRQGGSGALPSQTREVPGEGRNHKPLRPAPRVVGVRLPAAGLRPDGEGGLPGLRETSRQGTDGVPPVPGRVGAAPDERRHSGARPVCTRDAHRAAAAAALATADDPDCGDIVQACVG